VIHYHGFPVWPATAASRVAVNGHAFVSFRRAEQLGLVMEMAASFAVDNGAFSAWKSGEPVTDWSEFYAWVRELMRCPNFDFAVIPDVIDGDEAANDALIDEWLAQGFPVWTGAPVWHMHESLDRLRRLAVQFPRVCIGSSGEFATIGTPAWWTRMAEAMDVVCDEDGRPMCKLHGLRMLNPDVFTRFPFASADSTNIAQNVGIDSKWRGGYQAVNKEARAQVLRERIESQQSPMVWARAHAPIQAALELSFA
jgi:hypothetical protein